jgi:hypothetical protein
MIPAQRLWVWLIVLGGAISTTAFGEDALHVRIDRLIAEKFADQTPATRCDDATFLRRATLDFAGRIPTSGETRQFLSDAAPDKRAKVIDQFLAAPAYARRMENLFHVMLMERRGDNPEWSNFLQSGFEENRPWNDMAKAILAPKEDVESLRGGAFFYTKRLEKYGENPTDYSGLTRDVGRMFLGVDLQCAECHDHLFVEDYKQIDFQGLYFVYKNLGIRSDKFPAVKQTAMTEKLEFISVFDPTQRQTGPRVPFGKEFSIPPGLPKPEPAKKKGKEQPIVSSFDPLSLLAGEIASEGNEQFNKNIVNRLWFIMMGRGLVMPLDLFHSENPPSHPKLLDLLAKEFVAHKYDIQWFLRELALTETYQRDSQWPRGQKEAPKPESYLVALEKRLSAEQLLASVLVATDNAERLGKSADGKPNAEHADLEKRFLAAFANEAKEPELEFNATVKAALFLLNDGKVQELLKAHEGNLIDRLSKALDNRQAAEELFLNVFSRLPSEEEQSAVVSYLEKNAHRRDVALGHILWGMLSSIEFCVNH